MKFTNVKRNYETFIRYFANNAISDIKMSTSTMIRVSEKTKIRLESLAKYGETHGDIVEMLLWCYSKGGYVHAGGDTTIGNRTVFPLFNAEEEETIRSRLKAKLYEKISKTVPEIKKEISEKEKQAEKIEEEG